MEIAFELALLSLGTHLGTQVDPPAHYPEGGGTVEGSWWWKDSVCWVCRRGTMTSSACAFGLKVRMGPRDWCS